MIDSPHHWRRPLQAHAASPPCWLTQTFCLKHLKPSEQIARKNPVRLIQLLNTSCQIGPLRNYTVKKQGVWRVILAYLGLFRLEYHRRSMLTNTPLHREKHALVPCSHCSSPIAANAASQTITFPSGKSWRTRTMSTSTPSSTGSWK